jgi:hypothetical protein
MPYKIRGGKTDSTRRANMFNPQFFTALAEVLSSAHLVDLSLIPAELA